MSDLVKRLRNPPFEMWETTERKLCEAAADEIEATRKRATDLVKALSAAAGYLRNASIDLQTGAPKKTALRTVEGGLKLVEVALGQYGDAIVAISSHQRAGEKP